MRREGVTMSERRAGVCRAGVWLDGWKRAWTGVCGTANKLDMARQVGERQDKLGCDGRRQGHTDSALSRYIEHPHACLMYTSCIPCVMGLVSDKRPNRPLYQPPSSPHPLYAHTLSPAPQSSISPFLTDHHVHITLCKIAGLHDQDEHGQQQPSSVR